jgi:prolipoprotein diacylglyceryltransferase
MLRLPEQLIEIFSRGVLLSFSLQVCNQKREQRGKNNGQ